MYQTFIKPLLDITFATVLFMVLLPVFLVVALLVRIFLGSPIFFTQQRPTKGERVFTIYKFRTMRDDRDRDGNLLSDEVRLTKLGKFIRSTSLDEIPQLINIIKGDMSFVGPRPLLVEYLPRYNARQKLRHTVKAGITGLAQVNGRNAISWEKKLEYDAIYAEKISFWLDLMILFKTVKKVLIRDGISSENRATTEPFLGNFDRIYIYGGSGHGAVVAETAIRSNYKVEGFIDDNPDNGISFEEFLIRSSKEHFAVVVGIGDNATRQTITQKLKNSGVKIATIIDPSAVISPQATIGEGVVIFANSVINARAVIEEGAIINSGVVVEHDCVIGAFSHLAPTVAIAGGSSIGKQCFVGIGAKIINSVKIGDKTTIGAGAVVINDLSSSITAVGVPAKEVKK